jgi:hypothetical protein
MRKRALSAVLQPAPSAADARAPGTAQSHARDKTGARTSSSANCPTTGVAVPVAVVPRSSSPRRAVTGQTDGNGDGDGGGGDVGGGGDGGGGFDGGYNDWRGGASGGGAQELESKKRTGQTDDNGDGDGGWVDVGGGGGGGGGFDGGYANLGLLGSNVEDLVAPNCLDAMSYILDASSDTRLMFDSDKWRLHLSREGVVLALVDLEKALRHDLGFEVWACYIVDDEMDRENNVFRCRYYY